jgi:hypothetical protein
MSAQNGAALIRLDFDLEYGSQNEGLWNEGWGRPLPRLMTALPPISAALQPRSQSDRQPFAKLKALLRKIAARTVSSLWDFTPQECANYLANVGYLPLNRNRL